MDQRTSEDVQQRPVLPSGQTPRKRLNSIQQQVEEMGGEVRVPGPDQKNQKI